MGFFGHQCLLRASSLTYTTLLGAEVSFVCLYASTYPFGSFGISRSIYTKEWLASSLYFSLTQAFTTGTGPWSVQQVATAQSVTQWLTEKAPTPRGLSEILYN